MVWGCFSGSRVGDQTILQCHAVPSGMHVVGQGFILQQDTDSKHKSKLCQNYLRKKDQDGKLENNFSIKNWKNWGVLKLLTNSVYVTVYAM